MTPEPKSILTSVLVGAAGAGGGGGAGGFEGSEATLA